MCCEAEMKDAFSWNGQILGTMVIAPCTKVRQKNKEEDKEEEGGEGEEEEEEEEQKKAQLFEGLDLYESVKRMTVFQTFQ